MHMEITASSSSCLFIPTTISLLMPSPFSFSFGRRELFFLRQKCTDNICIIDARQRQSLLLLRLLCIFGWRARICVYILCIYLFPFLFSSLSLFSRVSLITHANSCADYDSKRQQYRYICIYTYPFASSSLSGRFSSFASFISFFFFVLPYR